jgi:hypothetical protein
MLETIAKGRPVGGRPTAPAAKNAPDDADRLADVLTQQRAAQVQDLIVLEAQREAYDSQTEESTEMEREYNNNRDMVLAQMKADDEIVKKFIAMI